MKQILGLLFVSVFSLTATAAETRRFDFKCISDFLDVDADFSIVVGQTSKDTKVFVYISGRGFQQSSYAASFGPENEYSQIENYSISKDWKSVAFTLKGENVFSEGAVRKNSKLALKLTSTEPFNTDATFSSKSKMQLVLYPENTEYFSSIENENDVKTNGLKFYCGL